MGTATSLAHAMECKKYWEETGKDAPTTTIFNPDDNMREFSSVRHNFSSFKLSKLDSNKCWLAGANNTD